MREDYPFVEVISKIDPTVKPFVYVDTFKESDKAFLCATWANSYQSSFAATLIPKSVYKRSHYDLIEAILTYPSTQIRVIRLKDEPTSILSYSVVDICHSVLHYTYTKFEYRKNALAQNLVLGRGLKYISMPAYNLLPHWARHLNLHPYFLMGVMSHYGERKTLELTNKTS